MCQNWCYKPFRRPTCQQSQRDPDTMDIDMATVGKGIDHANWHERGGSLNNAKWKKWQDKGCCDWCRHQGHMCWNCPKINEGGRNGKGGWYEERAWVITMEGRWEGSQLGSRWSDDNHAPMASLAYDTKTLLNQPRTMMESKCNELLDQVMEEPGF